MYIAIDENTCLCVYPKVASMSIHKVAETLNLRYLNPKEALTFRRRVAFVRDPIERIKAVFNHFYHLRGLGRAHQKTIPARTIKGFGAALSRGRAFDFGKWDKHDIKEFEEIKKSKTDKETLIKKLNNQDYKRFIDHILFDGADDHIRPQYLISMHKGNQVANEFYNFEFIAQKFKEIVNFELQKINSWPNVQVNDEYRLEELTDHFRLDYSARGLT